MKAVFKLNPSVSVEVESDNLKDLIDKISEIRESIGPEPCGKCKSENTFPNARKVGDDIFYEIRCADCDAVLQLGTSKADQKLYKKRLKTDNKGKAVKENDKAVYLPDNGWLKWNYKTKTME